MADKFTLPSLVPKQEKPKKPINSKAKINKDTKVQITAAETPQYKCSCCGRVYKTQDKTFLTTNSPLYAANSGYTNICRACADQYYDHLLEFFDGDEYRSIERFCQLFDWFYCNEACDLVPVKTKGDSGASRGVLYKAKTAAIKFQTRGSTYLDTLKERSAKIVETPDDVEKIEPDEEGYHVSKETVEFFGYGFEERDYAWLESQYADWIARHECKSKAQEELFKSLCYAQLDVQRAQIVGGKDLASALKTFQDLLGSANLKPAQNNDNALADQNTFGTLIKKWENERPIPEPDEEWRDVDGIRKYVSVWFLGHLCKLLKIDNDWARMYEAEKEKFTVYPPEYDGDEVFGEIGVEYSTEGGDSE